MEEINYKTFRKITKEFKRIIAQVFGVPGWTARLLFNNPYHDLVLRKRNQVTEGEKQITTKLAIYLIFPAKGVDEFHRRTIRELNRNNYSTIIVSNLFLTETDKSYLKKNSLKIIERVNFGYDFGGYREAILSDISLLMNCKKLFLINDSSIFPLQSHSTWLQEAESSGWDLTGSISMFPYEDPSNHSRKAASPGKKIAVNRKFHYGSFALLLSETIAQSKGFQHFFRHLKLSSVKREVIKRGEMGLSRWAIKQGYSHGALLSSEKIAAIIKNLSQEELMEEISLAVIPEKVLPAIWEEKRQELLQPGPKKSKERQQAAINWLESFSVKFHPAYFLPHLLHSKCGYQFLKKAVRSSSKNSSLVYTKILRSSKDTKVSQ